MPEYELCSNSLTQLSSCALPFVCVYTVERSRSKAPTKNAIHVHVGLIRKSDRPSLCAYTLISLGLIILNGLRNTTDVVLICGRGGSVVSSVPCVRESQAQIPLQSPRRDLAVVLYSQLPVALRRVNSNTVYMLYTSGAPMNGMARRFKEAL